MAKLAFLVGRWEGEARIYRGPGEPATAGTATILAMTEEAQYRLDGLILMIEGIGRTMADDRPFNVDPGRPTAATGKGTGRRQDAGGTKMGKPALQAIGFISYDDAACSYYLRAFNEGRFLETEVKLGDDGKSLTWGFTLEHIQTSSVLRINARGEWTEEHEITIGEQPARRFMEVVVRRVG